MSAAIDSEFLNALNEGVEAPKRTALVHLAPIYSDVGMEEGLISFISRTSTKNTRTAIYLHATEKRRKCFVTSIHSIQNKNTVCSYG